MRRDPVADADLPAPTGTQSIRRANLLVRLVAARNRIGSRLVELVEQSGLERPTVRRILKCLVSEGLVIQDAGSRRYFLGPLIFELGLAAAPRFNLRELCRDTLLRIAEQTGDTVFLTVRSGHESVCLDRAEGSFPIKALTLDIGTRRPLGVGAGGVALLMPLADSEIDAIAAVNAPRFGAHNDLTVESLRQAIAHSRSLGYALNELHMTPGATSIGLPVLDRHDNPLAAISIGAISSRMAPERRSELVTVLRQEVRHLEGLLGDSTHRIAA